jgi:hypothetical protein
MRRAPRRCDPSGRSARTRRGAGPRSARSASGGSVPSRGRRAPSRRLRTRLRAGGPDGAPVDPELGPVQRRRRMGQSMVAGRLARTDRWPRSAFAPLAQLLRRFPGSGPSRRLRVRLRVRRVWPPRRDRPRGRRATLCRVRGGRSPTGAPGSEGASPNVRSSIRTCRSRTSPGVDSGK